MRKSRNSTDIYFCSLFASSSFIKSAIISFKVASLGSLADTSLLSAVSICCGVIMVPKKAVRIFTLASDLSSDTCTS